MGTGVGEAMLISAATGAAVGGGVSAVTGGDPLKGALLGALGGGATAGIGGALAGGAGSGLASGTMGSVTGGLEGGLGAAGTSTLGGAGSASLGAPGISSLTAAPGVGVGATQAGLANVGNITSGFGGTAGSGVGGGFSGVNTGMASNLAGGTTGLGGATPSSGITGLTSYTPSTSMSDITGLAYNPNLGPTSSEALLKANQLPSLPSTGDRRQDSTFINKIGQYIQDNPYKSAAYGGGMTSLLLGQPTAPGQPVKPQAKSPFKYSPSTFKPLEYPYMAEGGPVESMSMMNQGYMANRQPNNGYDRPIMPITGDERFNDGGIASLGGYSDGGRLLKGPGDGVSDDIPARIEGRQPARLADGEFVIPARIVSEIGNGSTDAGARQLYSMMDRIQKKRSKSIGKDKVAVNSRAYKELPA